MENDRVVRNPGPAGRGMSGVPPEARDRSREVSIHVQAAKGIYGVYWLAQRSKSPLTPLYERGEPEKPHLLLPPFS
jgi:hypothetical protein